MKKEHGIYYTRRSPFERGPFQEWIKSIPNFSERTLIEPFAGENSIPFMLNKFRNVWTAQDINVPKKNLRSDIVVLRGNSFVNYPPSRIEDVAITNPPYLAKNIAKRTKTPYPNSDEDDLYKIALRVMLEKHDFVAAIIPASFLTSEIHDQRIFGIDLMIGKYFDDTDHPTCLAMFGPKQNRDWRVWKEGVLIGKIRELRSTKNEYLGKKSRKVVFNRTDGQISLLALDKPKNGRIAFGPPALVSSSEIKVSSRARTKIFVEGLKDANALINDANKLLEEFRAKTGDVFLTPYRGLRDDGDFRRRLDFKQAAGIINKALENDKL